MVAHQRIGPDGAFVREIADIRERIKSIETAPAGTIVIREQLIAQDPVTGVKTIVGQLPDGSVGFQPFVGDIVPPPVATTPVVSVQPGIFTISWDGLFVGNEAKPADFEHVNVIGHKMDGASTVKSVTVGVIRLASDTVLVTQDIAAIGETWQFSLESEDFNGNTAVKGNRSVSVVMESVVTDAGVNEALELINQDLIDAQSAAASAQGAADTAQQAADDAARAALEASQLADSKGVVYTQADTPAADYSGLWIDTAHSNIPRRYLGVRKALVMYLGGGASIAGRLSSLGWAVSSITTTPSLEEASKYDLVAMDAGYAGIMTAPRELATKLFERGVSLFTTGNDTTMMPPLFTSAPNRGTPKNSIRYVSNGSSGPSSYADYTDSDLNLYLTGVNTKAKITGVTLVGSVDQPVNLIMEHETNFARWAHVETYASPTAVLNSHLGWVSDNWVAIQDQGVISAASAAASAQLKADQAFNNAATAATAAGNAQTTANGKNTNWYQPDQPAGTGHKVGDTWFDTDDNYKLRTWNGSIWQTTQDAWTAQQTADSKALVYTQATVPPVEARVPTTIWNDTSLGLDKVVVKYWSSTANAWTPLVDKAATEARTVADSKGETIYSSTEPATEKRLPQNLWVDTTGGINIHKRWDGSAWVVAADSRIESTATAVTAAQADADTAQQTAESKGITYTQSTVPPVEARLPQNLWNDTSLGLDKIVVKYWNGSTWAALADKVATDAAAVAATKTKTYFQTGQPGTTGNTTGDIWFDTDDGNKAYVWSGSAWTIAQDATISKSIFGTFSTDIDQLQPNKWLFTRYNKTGLTNTVIPSYLDIVGLAGTSSLIPDATDLVVNIAEQYIGQLRSIVYLSSAKTISVTATHDDGAQIYVDGVSVYAKASFSQNVAISFSMTAGWHVLDLLWQEASGGDGWSAISPTFGSQFTSMYAPVSLTATSQAVADAQKSADTAMNAQAYSTNASFDNWTGTAPAGFGVWAGTPTKETSVVRRAPYSLRFNVADATVQHGLAFSEPMAHAPNLEYFTVEMEFYLVSGTLGGAGMILDWAGMTNSRAQINLASEITSPLVGKWYRVVKTLRRPTNASGTWSKMSGYLMGQWSGHGTGAAKEIIYDWFNVRPATTEEITSYGAPAKYTELSNATAAKGETIFSSTEPATTKRLAQNLWVDTTGGINIHKRWDGSAWVVVADSRIAQSASDITTLKSQVESVSAQADRSITTFYGTTTPADPQEGDLWLSGVAGTPMKRYTSGGAWEVFEDPNVQAAYEKAGDAQSTADAKVRTFAEPTAPAGMLPDDIGDLWIDTDDKNRLYRWDGAIWQELRDDTIADAQDTADTALSTASSAVSAADAAQTTADGKNTSYYQPGQPSGGTYKVGDLWFDTDDSYKMRTYTGSTWQLTQDSAGAKQEAIEAAQIEIDKVWASARSYVNPLTSIDGIVKLNGVSPAVTGSSTAMGGQALIKQSTSHGWWADTNGKQAFDPTALYRLTARIRIASPATSGGGTVYVGVNGYAADGTTYVNQTGANSYSSQHYLISQTFPATERDSGAWVDFVGYFRGNSTGNMVGGNTALDPKKLHANVRYFEPMVILDYSNGNGVWELSHIALDVIDSTGYQAIVDADAAAKAAASKNATYYEATKPTGGTYKKGDIWFNTAQGNRVYTYNGSDFVDAQDTAIKSASDAASAAQTTADGKNKVIWSTSAASGTTGYKAGDIWFQRDASNNIIGQWEFTTSWQSRAIDNAVIANLNAGKLTAGTIAADRFGANTIHAGKLVVSDPEELIPNPFFHPNGEPVIQGTRITTATSTVSAGAPYPYALKLSTRDTIPFGTANIAVRPGDEFFIEAKVRAVSTTTRAFNFYIFGSSTPTAGLSAKFASGILPSNAQTWVDHKWSFKVPDNANYTYIKPVLQVETVSGDTVDKWEWYVTGWTMRRKNTGVLIVDGAIKANSAIIAEGAIGNAHIGELAVGEAEIQNSAITNAKIKDATIEHGKISTLDAGKITVGLLQGWQIAANAIDASKLNVSMGGPNLVANSSFEADTNGDGLADGWQTWTRGSGDASRTFANTRPAGLFPGSVYAQRVTSNNVSNTEQSSIQATTLFSVGPSVSATLSFYGRASVAGTYNISIRCQDDAGNYKGDASLSFPFTTETQHFMGTVITHAGTTAGKITITTPGSLTSGHWFEVDGVQAQLGNVGTTWGPMTEELLPGTIKAGMLAADSVVATNIKGDAIDGKTITGATLQTTSTASRGIKLTSTELAGYDGSGVKNFSLTSTGTLTLKGAIQSGSTIEGATITGTTGIQTSTATSRGVKVTNSGVSAFDGSGNMTFKLDGSTGVVELPGLKANSISSTMISATAIDGKTITGATVQTETTASRGIKLTSTELAGYNGSGVKNFSLTSAGALTLTGAIKTGSTIEGATITGTTGIQTSTATSRGVKITSTGVSAFDGSGNMTFRVDGTSGMVEAPGMKANSITGDKIAAKTLSVANLMVSDFNNYLENPDFETGDLKGWDVVGGWFVNTAAPYSGTYKALTQYTGALQSITNKQVVNLPVDGKVRVKFRIYSEAPTSGIQASIALYDVSTGSLESTTNVTGSGAWTEIDRILTATTVGDKRLQISTTGAGTGYVRVDAVSVEKMDNGSLIVDGSLKTTHFKSDTIDGGIITAGSLSGTKVEAKSIRADHLVISSTDNLIVESNFEHPTNPGASWTKTPDNPNATVQVGGGRNGANALRLSGTTSQTTSWNLNNKVVVEQDDKFAVKMWLRTNVAYGNGQIRLGVRPYIGSTAGSVMTLFSNSSNAASANYVPGDNTWKQITGFTNALPAGTTAVEFYLSSVAPSTTAYVDFDSVAVTRAADGKLVVDGAIDGKTITGALFQTTNETDRGIKLDSLGFRAYNPTGGQTFAINGATGAITSIGEYYTETLTTQEYEDGQNYTLTSYAKFGVFNDAYSDQVPGVEFKRSWNNDTFSNPGRISYTGGALEMSVAPEGWTIDTGESSGSVYVHDKMVNISTMSKPVSTAWANSAAISMSTQADSSKTVMIDAHEFVGETEVGSIRPFVSAFTYKDAAMPNGISGSSQMGIYEYFDNGDGTNSSIRTSLLYQAPGGKWSIAGETPAVENINNTSISGNMGETGKIVISAVGGTQFYGDITSYDDVILNGGTVDASAFKVNGVDMSNGEVQTWYATGSVGSGVIPVPRIQTFSAAAGDSTTTGLSTTSTGFITITNTGVYDIHWSYNQNAPTNQDRNFLEIKTDGAGLPITRTTFGLSEDSASSTATGVRLAAGQKLYFEIYQNSGATRTYNSLVRIKRVSAPTPTTGWQSGSITHSGDLTVTGKTNLKPGFAQFVSTNFAIAGNNTPWDSGPVTETTAKSVNNDFAVAGPYAGSVQFTKSGWYQISHFMVASGSPGASWSRLFLGSTGENLVQVANANGQIWEQYLSTIPIYIASGDYVRSTVVAATGHNATSTWKIARMPWSIT